MPTLVKKSKCAASSQCGRTRRAAKKPYGRLDEEATQALQHARMHSACPCCSLARPPATDMASDCLDLLKKSSKRFASGCEGIDGVDREEAVGGLDEEAAQALHHAGADPDVGAAPVELCLQLRGAQQRRLQEEVVPAHRDHRAPSLQIQCGATHRWPCCHATSRWMRRVSWENSIQHPTRNDT